jgi:HAD superfamily hydrolase (TIGR01549 family)
MVKNIIWDFDGTLFDTYPAQTELLSDIARNKYNITIPQNTIREYTSISLSHALLEISKITKVDIEEIKSVFIENYSNLPLEKEYPFNYVMDICNKIVSKNGRNIINTHRGKERLTKLLNKYEMEELFSDIISYEDNIPRKPDPASFNILINRNKLSVKNTLVIGDRELDIIAGREAGLQTYFFNSNNINITEIECDFIEKDLGRVLSLI